MIRLANILKIPLQEVLKKFLQDVLKTSWKLLEDVFRMYSQDEDIDLDQDFLKTSWRRLLKTYDYGECIRLDQDVLKTTWRCFLKTKTKDVFIKTNVWWEITSNTTFCLYFLKDISPTHFQSLFGRSNRDGFLENENKIQVDVSQLHYELTSSQIILIDFI